ncbi:MAG: radical SAM protein [Thermodesulfovibrionales bacterium]
MKILFVIHQLDFADHIAISYLSAIAKQLGHETFFCSLASSDLSNVVKTTRPDVVAYSVNVVGFKDIVEEHRKAITVHPFVSILGGPQATFSPETFAESGMDAYCIGEGDYAFRDFLNKVTKGESFDDIANLITRQAANPVRPLIRNLDELPEADRDLVLENSYLKNTPKKTFYATRGCPFKCAYCCNNFYHNLYKGKGPIVRRFSVERIIREIECVKRKYSMDFIKFGDDLFAMHADAWLEEFSEKYSKRIGVPFNCYLRFDTVSEQLLNLIKKAGCYSVHLSVDSTSRHIRENILNRHNRDVNIVEQLRMIRAYDINTWVNYMLAAPESTVEDDIMTMELSRAAKVTYPSYSITVPVKGTLLYNYCVEKKIIDPATHSSDLSGCTQRPTMPCFSEKEKNIRYNIFLLGAIMSKLPVPLYKLSLRMIQVLPPNGFFKKARKWFYEYSINNKIFKLPRRKLKYGNTQNKA